MIHDVGLRFKYSHQKFRSNSLLGLSLGCIQPDLKFDLRSKSRTTLIRSLTSDSIRSSIQNLEKLHHMICNGLLFFLLLVQCAFDAIQGLNLESWASQMEVKWKIRYCFFSRSNISDFDFISITSAILPSGLPLPAVM